MKYVHLNESDSEARLMEAREKMQKAHPEVQGGHSFGHSRQLEGHRGNLEADNSNDSNELWCARRGSNSRPNDSKSFALSN